MGFGCGRLLEYEWKREGWALIEAWHLLTFSASREVGRLFE